MICLPTNLTKIPTNLARRTSQRNFGSSTKNTHAINLISVPKMPLTAVSTAVTIMKTRCLTHMPSLKNISPVLMTVKIIFLGVAPNRVLLGALHEANKSKYKTFSLFHLGIYMFSPEANNS